MKIFRKLDNDEFEESYVSQISDQTGIYVGFHGYILSNKSFLVAHWRTLINKNDPGVHWRESQMLHWRENSINFTPKCARNWLSDPRVLGPDKQKSKNEKKIKSFKNLDNDEFEESEVFKIPDQIGIHVGFHGYIRSKKSKK